MKISLIIVAYKSADVLLKCMDSFKENNDLGNDIEVIIVDNSPEENRVLAEIKRSNLKEFVYIPAENNGFGAGNNIGAKKAKGEILAFINPDIIFIEPIFKNVYREFQQNSNLMILGGKLLHNDLTPTFSFYFDYKYSYIKKWTLKMWNCINKFDSKNMYIAGADIFIRRDAFFKAGMFDENIFMYYEEPDLTRRIMKTFANYTIKFSPHIRMIHLEKMSTPKTTNSIKYEIDSLIYYGKKYNLNYTKKINFEYKYLKIKYFIYKMLKSNKSLYIYKNIEYIKEKYSRFLI